MILPSEGDSRDPHSKPGGRDDDSSFSDAVNWGSDEIDDATDEQMLNAIFIDATMKKAMGYFGDSPDGPEDHEIIKPAGEGWREDLRDDLLDSLLELETIEDPDENFDPPEPPDMRVIMTEFAVLKSILRAQSEGGSPALPLAALELVFVYDQLFQIGDSEKNPAFQSLESAMRHLGMEPIPTRGRWFKPSLMTCAESIAGLPVSGRIVAEIKRGFTLRGRLIRPAYVTVKLHPSQK